MRRYIAVLAVAIQFALVAMSQGTDVFGDVYGEWTLAGSPYYVIRDVSVPQDCTLIIGAGVEVLFWGYFKFNVQANATLQALGGPGLDSVRFSTPFTSAGWHGLRFFTASPACSLAYCVFEYGQATSGSPGEDLNGGAIYCASSSIKIYHSWIRTCTSSNGGGIYCSNSNPTISDNTISNNSATSGNYGGGGIYCSNSNPTIRDNTIIGNSAKYGGGIYLGASSSAIINGNTINNNSTTSYYGGRGGGIYCTSSSPTISGNTISNNYTNNGGGIYLGASSSPIINGNTISNNSATHYGGGIYCTSSSPTISGNIISNNSATSYGGGIYCDGSSAIINGNTINSNSGSSGGGIYCTSSSPIINGNTINSNSGSSGGGIYCASSIPTISGNTISNNSATSYGGGGIYCSNSNPTIGDNTISNNSATSYGGSGIYCSNSNPTISDNTITGNTTLSNGGGIYCDNSSPSVSSNVIQSNSGQNGGGIFTYNSHPNLDLNEISKNHATYGNGGGLYCSGYVNPMYQILNKNTCYGNTATVQGGGFYLTTSNVVLKNSIFWLNQDQSGMGNLAQIYPGTTSSAAVTYSDVKGGWPGTGNINLYPVFVDTSANNYHLQATSPCINTGDPDPIYNDPDGTRADMGCYYFDQGAPSVTLDLIPTGSTVVPAGGGPLPYSLTLTNNESTSLPFHYWCTYSQGTIVVAAFGPVSRTSPAGPGYAINRLLTQIVAASLGSGAWNYNGYIGSYPDYVWVSDSFPFTKTAVDEGGAYYAEGTCIGWEDEEVLAVGTTPIDFELIGNYPNPFNPTTTLSYKLQAASRVNLDVYDTTGRLAATLVDGWREAGYHEVTFDGTGLASGVYIYALKAGEFAASGKMVLMK